MATLQSSDPGADHVPPQYTGSEMNAVEKIELPSELEAIHFFKTVKERLLDINSWSHFAGEAMSIFRLTDSSGNEVNRKATDGDYIKIDIPGPGPSTGQGFDWVVIEDIRSQLFDDAEVLSITVRPASNPASDKESTAHFLTDEATSTFQVKRLVNIITAEEHGRNEMANTDTESVLDNIRNTFVGLGAKLGFSYPQWKSLVKGLLNNESAYK